MVYNFFDYLGDVGGFFEAIKVLGLILTAFYAHNLYFASLIRQVFKIRTQAKGAKINHLVSAKIHTRNR